MKNVPEQQCIDCGINFYPAFNTWRTRKNINHLWRCNTCLRKRHHVRMIELHKNKVFARSEEDIKRISNRQKEIWANRTPEERGKILRALHNGNVVNKDEIKQKLSIKAKDRWHNMNSIDREKISKRMSIQSKNYWKNLSLEEKERLGAQRSIFVTRYLEGLSDKEKINKISNLNNKWRVYWENLSDEQRAAHNKKLFKHGRDYWEGLTKEEYKDSYEARGQKISDAYYNTDVSKLISWRTKSLKSSNNNIQTNKLHRNFESYFNSNSISSEYYLTDIFTNVCVFDNVRYVKSWDYGVFTKCSNKLNTVIDLDGTYFHADNCDYNGIHNREEYDERRYKLIPENIKLHILYEQQLDESFNSMVKVLNMTYEEFLDYQFQLCRSMPFPYLSYTHKELSKSYNQLSKLNINNSKYVTMSTNNREGDRIIYHFHQAIYQTRYKDYKYSPYEAWYNDTILKEIISKREIYVNPLNPNKILQGFNVSDIARKVPIFSAGKTKLLIHKYLNDYDTIFNPSNMFSSIMLGAISLNKKYIGFDDNEIRVEESNDIINHFGFNKFAKVTYKNILNSFGTYDCLFTEVENDSMIDLCLEKFKCSKYLFVINHTDKYKDFIVDDINDVYIVLI